MSNARGRLCRLHSATPASTVDVIETPAESDTDGVEY